MGRGDKKKARTQHTGAYLALSFFIFFVLLFNTYAAAGGMAFLRSREEDVPLTDWHFLWEEESQALEGDIRQWNVASAEMPVRKPADQLLNPMHLRLRATLPSTEEEELLRLVTAGHPLKVVLDGEEIYNNQYSTASYTGNRINIVTLPPRAAQAKLELFLSVPYAFRLDAHLTAAPFRLGDMAGLAAGSLALSAAVMLSLMLFFFSRKSGTVGSSLWLALLLLGGGANSFLASLLLYMTKASNPLLWKIQPALLMWCAACVVCSAIHATGEWKRLEKAAVIPLLAAPLLFLFLEDRVGRWILVAFLFLLLFASLLAAMRIWDARRKVPYTPALIAVFPAGIACLIFDLVGLFSSWAPRHIELRHIGVLVYGTVLFAVLTKRALHIRLRQEERELLLDRNNLWVEKTVACFAGIFSQNSMEGFCRETALAIKELLLFDHALDSVGEGDPSPTLSICMALIREGEFEDIYVENPSGPCAYSRIVERAESVGDKPILFGEHTLDMLLYSGKNPACILHVDGIVRGVSVNLQNMLRSTYTGIAAALSEMELKNDIIELQENVFIGLAEIAEQKESDTGAHLRIVAEMTAVFCDRLNMPEHEKRIVSAASMVHDIGKLAIPETILSKKGPLTEDEYAVMQDHVIYGYNIMSKSPGDFMSAAAIIAQQHHEKYDGTGYLELRGEQIHLYARIVTIIDVFDALLSERPYKQAWPDEQACQYIRVHAGTHFDPRLVDVFEECKEDLMAVKRRHSA